MNRANSKKLLFVVNVDWFFLSHRLQIAEAAMNAGYEVHLVTKITDKLDTLKSYGFKVHPIDIRRGSKDSFADILSIYHIYKVFKNVCPDIVHLVTLKVILLGGIASKIAQVPSIVYSVAGLGHIFVSHKNSAKILRVFIGLAFKFILSVKNKRVIFQNQDDADIFKKITNLKSSKSIFLPGSGVDLSTYKPSPIPKNEIVIAMISRMIGDKGVYEFIDAVKILKSMKYNNPKYRFVLVGDVDYDNPTSLSTNQLKAWEKDDLIEYLGHQKNIPKVLKMVSLVVLPSYREGFPKILIEAAACGRPVVTTDVPGCRDAIEDQVTGLLVPVRDSEALANSIKLLIDNLDDCEKMGLAARERAMKLFDVRDIVDSHLNLYEDLNSDSRL